MNFKLSNIKFNIFLFVLIAVIFLFLAEYLVDYNNIKTPEKIKNPIASEKPASTENTATICGGIMGLKCPQNYKCILEEDLRQTTDRTGECVISIEKNTNIISSDNDILLQKGNINNGIFPIMLKRLRTETKVASAQFDIYYDTASVNITDIRAGAQSIRAQKLISWNVMNAILNKSISSTDSASSISVIRVIIVGVNNEVINDGELAIIEIKPAIQNKKNKIIAIKNIFVASEEGSSLKADSE